MMAEKRIKETNRSERFLLYAPLFLWIGVIFYMSSSSGSMSQTSRFIRPLLEWLFPNTPEDIITIYHGYIRKFAHFAEYALLAFFASRAFSRSSKFWAISAFLLVVLIASLDEFNQSFNTARTGSIYDVLLDVAGGLTIILLFFTGKKWFTE